MAIKKRGRNISAMLERPLDYKPEEILAELKKSEKSIKKNKNIKPNKFLRFFNGYEPVYNYLMELMKD